MSKKNMNTQMTAAVAITSTVEAKQKQEAVKYDIDKLFSELKSKSAVIRYLSAQGETVNAIHKILVAAGWKSKNGTDIRYQHVRNVLKQEPKKKSTTETQVQTSSGKESAVVTNAAQ